MTLARPFQYRNGELCCEDAPLSKIARDVGTPTYIYSESAIRSNFRCFRETFAETDPLICYAVKANSNLSILALLQEEGSGFDIVSGGEWHRLKRIQADPDRTVFSGIGKSSSELEEAVRSSLLSINVESLQELEQLSETVLKLDVRARIALRVNPDVGAETHPYIATGLRQHKFGIDLEDCGKAITRLQKLPHLELRGLGFHIGSQILDVQPFIDAFDRLLLLARELGGAGFQIHHLDLGGGMGIPYRDEEPPDMSRYARHLAERRADYRLLFEPGRVIVGSAGILLNRVILQKFNSGRRFVVVDGAMNDLMRPSLYQAHHEIRSVEERRLSGPADVVGPICESGDFFARERVMPEFRSGDLLAVMDSGAYGFALSSNYNSRPRAAEVLVYGDRFRIIRRRESPDDLIRGEEDALSEE